MPQQRYVVVVLDSRLLPLQQMQAYVGTAPMTREELPITALPCPFCGTMPYVAIKDRAVISCRGEDCFGPRTTADYLVDAIAQWNRRQVTVAMYQDRVKEILNLTDENDRLRSGVAQTVGWQPISTAPTHETVLVAGGDAIYPVTASWDGDTIDGWWVDGQEDVHEQIGWPTHWMPLPPSPSNQGASK